MRIRDKDNQRNVIKKIYFDMDGVLAGFNRGVRELCYMEPYDQNIKENKEAVDAESQR